MNQKLLELSFDEDCDARAKSVLLAAIKAKSGSEGREDFTFNRFNVSLDFGASEAVIDDDLNPSDGEFRMSLDSFAARVAAVGAA